MEIAEKYLNNMQEIPERAKNYKNRTISICLCRGKMSIDEVAYNRVFSDIYPQTFHI